MIKERPLKYEVRDLTKHSKEEGSVYRFRFYDCALTFAKRELKHFRITDDFGNIEVKTSNSDPEILVSVHGKPQPNTEREYVRHQVIMQANVRERVRKRRRQLARIF